MGQRSLQIVVVIVVAATVVGVVATWQLYSVMGVPIVVFPDGQSSKFGIVEEGTFLTHKFRIKNEGRGVLELRQFIKNCACIDVKIPKQELQPGEETNVIIGYEARAGGTEASVAAVTVETNDPSQRWFQLTLTGQVTRMLTFYPSSVMFFGRHEGVEDSRKVRLVTSQTISASAFKIEPSKDWISAQVVEVEDGLACMIALRPDCPGGNRSETVKLTVNYDKGTKQVHIPVILYSYVKKTDDLP